MKKLLSFLLSVTVIITSFILPVSAVEVNNGTDDNVFDIGEILPVPLETVYISSGGSDSNTGKEASPVLTLSEALSKVKDNGTIVISDTCTLASDFSWTAHNKAVNITGGTLDASGLSARTVTIASGVTDSERVCTVININDAVNFNNITIKVGTAAIFANGNKLTMGENVTVSGDLSIFGGGTANVSVNSTDVTLLSGTYTYVFAGSFDGVINGNTNLYIGGTVNSGITVGDGQLNHAYGGGWSDTINGSTNVTVAGSARIVYVFGGSRSSGCTITGGCNTVVSGGTIMNLYGGSWNAVTGGGTHTVVTGGTLEAAFGGNQGGNVTGNTYLAILGGTITRRVYGGCYNNTNTSTLSFSTSYHVIGNATLLLGENANISQSSSNNDRSIYAHSRHNSPSTEENSILIYDGSTAYSNNNKIIKAQDFAMKVIMGSTTVADNVYTMSYSASGNVLTQTCSALNHTATATVDVDTSQRYVENGVAVTPAIITFSDGWYNDVLSIAYANNINAGTATASITRDGVTASKSFTILGKYTVTFDYGALKDNESVTVVEGDSITLPDTGFALDNNWYSSSSGNISSICQSEITVNSDMTLYCLGSLVDIGEGNAQYIYSQNYTAKSDNGTGVIYYGATSETDNSYGSNHLRIKQVEDNTTYKISVTYKAVGDNLGFAFMAANKDNIYLHDTALHGGVTDSLYEIKDTNGEYITAVMFVTTDLMGTVTESVVDDIKTVLGDYLYLSLKDNDASAVSELYIKDISCENIGLTVGNSGVSILTDQAAATSNNQALRYYFDYVTDDGSNIYIDGVSYKVVERGFLYKNGNFVSYTENGATVEGTGGMTVDGQTNLVREYKRDGFDVCWLYSDTDKKMQYSTHVKGFKSGDSRKLMVRGYVTILVDGQEMTIYSSTTNRSVEGMNG